MATPTPNLTLTQYSTTDNISFIDDYNVDMTKIDTTTGKLSNLTTTDKTNLVSATNELKTTLSNRGTSTLLATITATTNTSTTVANMTAFKWIYVDFFNSGLVVDSRTIPLDKFNGGSTMQLNTYYTSYIYGNVQYVDATHVTGYVSVAGASIRVYGVK